MPDHPECLLHWLYPLHCTLRARLIFADCAYPVPKTVPHTLLVPKTWTTKGGKNEQWSHIINQDHELTPFPPHSPVPLGSPLSVPAALSPALWTTLSVQSHRLHLLHGNFSLCLTQAHLAVLSVSATSPRMPSLSWPSPPSPWVQLSRSVMSDSLRPHGLQHARLPCPSPTPGACSDSCPSSNAIQPSYPLLSPSPPAFNLSQHQDLFKWVSISIKVAKVLAFKLQHQSFNEYSGLISFRIDWLDLLAVQGTLKKLLQHHSSKASILWHSAFFIVQLSHPYMTIGKTIALTT